MSEHEEDEIIIKFNEKITNAYMPFMIKQAQHVLWLSQWFIEHVPESKAAVLEAMQNFAENFNKGNQSKK